MRASRGRPPPADDDTKATLKQVIGYIYRRHAGCRAREEQAEALFQPKSDYIEADKIERAAI